MRFPVLLLAVLAPTVAVADVKLCVIDAQTALNETAEGKSARTKLESTFSAKQAALTQMGKDLEKQVADYEARKMILSDSAKKEQEASLMKKQTEWQQKMMEAEQEMQQMYQSLLAGIEEKLYKSAGAVAATKGCTVLLPKEATIYVASSVTDLTKDVIADLDAK